MQHTDTTTHRATPRVLPPAPWTASQAPPWEQDGDVPIRAPSLAYVQDADGVLIAVVNNNRHAAGTALRVAERMAASVEAIRLLGQLRAAVQTGSGREIDAACAAADALLGRLGEGQP